MAKKGDFDDLDLDNMDWDDFGEPPRQKDTKRNPVLNTLNTVRKSALAAVWPKGKRDQVIMKGMPKPAADAYKGYQDVSAAAKDIAAHTKEEVVKTNRVIKQQVRQLTPTMRRYLPDNLTRKMERWSKSDDQQYNNYDPRQAQMDRELGGVFGGGGEGDYKDAVRDQADAREQAVEDRVRDSIREMKSDAMFGVVNTIAKDIHLQTSLQKGVMLNISRKQLELQYRILFALEDANKLNQTQFDRNTPALEAIVKNTALPDYAKEEFSEIHWANIKRKAADWMNPLKYADGFVDQIRNNAKKKISEGFGDARGMLEMLMGSAIEDDFDLDDSSSLSADKRRQNGTQKAVGWLSSQAAKRLLGPQIEKLQKHTREKLEMNPEFMKQAQRGKFMFGNLSSISNSAIAGEDMGAAGSIFRALHMLGIINPLQREQGMLDEREPGMLSRASKFDHRTWLSINEIIPAWLSEINKSIRRGYGEHADMEYDITSRGFVDRKVIGNRVRKSVANDEERKRLQGSIGSTVDYLDHNKSLTQRERQKLADFIEERASTGKAFDVNALARDPQALQRFMGFEGADKIQQLMNSHPGQGVGGGYELSNELANRMATIQSSISRRQARIDAAAGLYGERSLRDAGIFHYDDKNDVFHVDRDLSDPHTLFNDLAMGKTRSGRALTREQEIRRKLENGSALGDLLRRRGMGGEGKKDEERRRGGGLGGGMRGGLSALALSNVLYGDKPTTFPELFEGMRSTLGSGSTSSNEDLVRAIRENNQSELLGKILDHVRDMNEEGVFILNSLNMGGDDLHGPSPGPGGPGGGGGSGGGLFRRWGRLGRDTAAGGWRQARRGFNSARARGGRVAAWLRGKFASGGAAGTSMFQRVLGMGGNALSGVRSFGKGLLGARDIYNSQGRVVLNGKRLAAGDYYQMGSGQGSQMKQLFSLGDIRMGRDIIDAAGNVILSAADLAQGGELTFYTGSNWKKLFDVIGNKAGEAGRGILSLPSRLASKIQNPLRTVKDWFTQAPDIYVKGEPNPRLFANRMREGEYRLKEGGRIIYKASEITGPVVDKQGNDVITAEELANPNFKLVDRFGRAVKSPLGRIVGRVMGIGRFAWNTASRIPSMVRGGIDRIKGMINDNPLTRWWGNRGSSSDSKWFSGNSFFGGLGGTKKTNHILLRIYKLLNQRLAGDPEDESWTDKMDEQVGGGNTFGRVKGGLSRAWRRGRVLGRRRWGRQFGNLRNRISGWFGRGRGAASDLYGRGAGVARDLANRYTGAEHDIGLRYLVEQRLAGRDDESADFYRDRLHRRKGLNGNRLRSDLSDAAEEATDAAGRAINTGKKKVQSVGQAMLEKLNRMVGLQEITWFEKMRSSTLEAGGSEGFIRGMMNKFTRRNKFGEATEKKDYLNFFRRKQSHRDSEGGHGGSSAGGGRGGVMGILDKLTGVIGGIGGVLGTLGTALGFVGKWGLLKPGKLLGRGAWALATRALPWVARSVAAPLISGAAALVTAVGWPAIAVGAAVAGIGYAAYKIATNVPAKYLDKMRLAQYGFRDYESWNSDDGAKARYLEDQLKGYISYNNDGSATLRGLSAADVEKLAAGFGVDKDEKSELVSFHAFMLQRFIPLYLRWMTSIRQLESDVALKDLGDVTKVSKEDMKTLFGKNKLSKDSQYLKAIEDPRKTNQGFFSKAWDTITFTSPDLLGADDVMDVQNEVEKSIKFRAEGAAAVRNHLAPPVAEGTKVSGVAESVNRLASLDQDRRDNTIKKEGWEDGNEQVTVQVDYNSVVQQKDVDALQSLRMKAYGLTTLNPAQVKSLLLVERLVYPNIDVKNNTYKGKWQEAIDALVPGGSTSEKADRLKYWFYNRFLPVFMTYVVGVYRYQPTANPLDLKLSGGYLYEVGLMTSRAYSMKNDIRQSIWDIAINPFGGDANTLATSVNAELESLHVLSKEADLAVRNLMRENEKKQGRSQWKQKDLTKGLYGGDAMSDNGVSSYAPGSAEAMRAAGLNGRSGYDGAGGGWNGSSEIAAAGGIANYAALTTGSTNVSLGQMGDGNYKELAEKYPRASLNNVANVKAMIVDVAQRLGVPPGVALGMAYAESKFNYKAWNKDSGAGGLFQFIKSTWSGRGGRPGELQNYGNKFGIPNGATQLDPYANALLGINFIRNNISQAQKDYGGQVPPGVAYLYHFLGAGDAAKFMKAYKQNPNAPANSIRYSSSGVIGNNMSVFTSGGRIRSFAQVMQELNGRMGSQVANIATSNSDLAKQAMSGQTPTDPARAAGAPAANDADGAVQSAERKDTALAQKGAQAANDAATQSASVTAPNPAGVSAANSPSDVAKNVENVQAAAEADGMSPEDAAKVGAGYANQAAAQARPRKAANDMPESAGELVTVSRMDELIDIEGQSRDYLKNIWEYLQKGGTLGNVAQAAQAASSAPGAASRKTQTTAPAPTLNLNRKAS